MFAFHDHFDLGEEPEVSQCQIQGTRWMRTQHNVYNVFTAFLLNGSQHIAHFFITPGKNIHE